MSLKRKTQPTIWLMPDVGEIHFNRNSRAKRLTISIKPNKEVRVTVPGFLSIVSAKAFVEQKKDWIVSKLKEISITGAHKAITSGYKTREHELLLIPSKTSTIRVSIANGQIKMLFPEEISSTSNEIQSAAKSTIENVFRMEAKRILPQKIYDLTAKHGFCYSSLRIKNITSRWGSCSSKNNINLSIYLMKLPDELVDYVILHELTHTIHKNHGPQFWNHLNKLTGNAKSLAARVKKYTTGV
ncbi:MAG: SprT family zinc-dependent metalloprotease [Tenuifilaceae bacterium]|nr:SprT family zinc-dependent metalloprotease [Tenuifilaceae bacterium]